MERKKATLGDSNSDRSVARIGYVDMRKRASTRTRKYRKRSRQLKLRKDTIYTLFAITLFFLSSFLFFSYTRNGLTLTQLNTLLLAYFGVFSFLVPLNLLFFALLLTRIRAGFTRPNISLGFLVLSLSLFGFSRSGIIGRMIFLNLESLLGSAFAYLSFFMGMVVGGIVFLNTSIAKIYGVFQFFARIILGVGTFFTLPFSFFMKKRQQMVVKDIKHLTIKGMRESQATADIAVAQPRQMEKKTELGDMLVVNKPLAMGMWEYPPLSLLSDQHTKKGEKEDVKKIASIIERTLESFGIKARVVEINVGPSVAQYALEIALGTKLSKITSLANDLALATEAPTGQIRIEAPIPGRSLVGIEVPNKSREVVSLKTMLSSSLMQKAKSKLVVPLGLDVSGAPMIIDIAKMPHVLVAGTTGSGKSVLINSFICSLLFRASPSEVRLILIDPKRVELTGYNDIPHLLVPVVVEPSQSVSALKWALKEMDRRYIKFAERGVRNIDSYNELAGFQALPYIVVLIDELADLMALAPVEVEDSITRLAQMARATGIHLVLSTQRPSVDVLTGLIKANIPCRIAFNVSSMIDSKVIIDTPGAEKLLGRGDMLYVPPDQAKPTRIQGTFVSDQEVRKVVSFVKARGIPVEYTQEVVEQEVMLKKGGMGAGTNEKDILVPSAIKIVCQYDRASSSLLQRKLSIGFNRAARIIEQLEELGVVGPGDGSKPRDVILRNPDELLSQLQT